MIRSTVRPRAQRPGADGLSPWPRKRLAVVAGVVSWAELNWAAPRRIHIHEAIPAPIEDVERVVPSPGSIVVVDSFTRAAGVVTRVYSGWPDRAPMNSHIFGVVEANRRGTAARCDFARCSSWAVVPMCKLRLQQN